MNAGNTGTHNFATDFETADQFASLNLASIAALMINLKDKDIVETEDRIIVSDNDSVYTQFFTLHTGDLQIPFIVEYNRQLKINHLGIMLFPRDGTFYDNPVLSAAERLLLQTSLVELSGTRAEDYFRTTGVKILLDGEPLGSLGFGRLDRIRPIMQAADEFKLQNKDFQYILSWKKDRQQVDWIIPARAELITGLDKRELDAELTKQILAITPSEKRRESKRVPVDQERVFQLSSGLWLEQGEVFFEGVTQNRYFRKSDNEYELLFDQDFFSESIQNLLLDTLRIVYNASLDLNIRTHKPQELWIEYHDLIDFFDRNCEIYAGLESSDDDSVRAVVVFEDRRYNHIHLLSLRVPKTFIGGRGWQQIRGKLFLHIRRDNVDSIFSAETVDKKEQLFQIRLK